LQFGYGAEEVVMYYDFTGWELYENGLGDVIFTDVRTGKEIEKEYSFVYWGDIERDTYRYIDCPKVETEFSSCTAIINGTETYKGWIPYNSKDIPKENIRIGLKTYIDRNDYIDGVWTIAGKEVTKHAEWFANLNVNLEAYYGFDETSGAIVVDSIVKQNLTNVGMAVNQAGLLGTSYAGGDTKYAHTTGNVTNFTMIGVFRLG